MRVEEGRRLTPKGVAALLAALSVFAFAAETAHACPCEEISPAEGFAEAEYVFTGKVAEEVGHTWTIDVDRVWKGGEKLAGRVRLLDVYNGIDCAFYFETGRSYLFFAIVAKSSRYVYYQPQVCNWTSPLHSKRVRGPDGPLWLEDLIVKDHGAGDRPTAMDPWEHLPAESGGAQD
jgi:hypothetical protein